MHLACLQLEVDVVEHPVGTEALADPLQPDQRRGVRPPPRAHASFVSAMAPAGLSVTLSGRAQKHCPLQTLISEAGGSSLVTSLSALSRFSFVTGRVGTSM